MTQAVGNSSSSNNVRVTVIMVIVTVIMVIVMVISIARIVLPSITGLGWFRALRAQSPQEHLGVSGFVVLRVPKPQNTLNPKPLKKGSVNPKVFGFLV